MTKELAESMKAWLDSHPARSRRSLHKKTFLGYQTISDLLSLQRNASLETVFRILPVICTYEEELVFLKKHVPSFNRYLK